MTGHIPDAEDLPQAAFAVLSLPVCVLDHLGVVRLASRSWGTAARTAGSYESTGRLNYLKTLEHLAAQGDVHARLMRDGIASVMAGRVPHFRLEYPLNPQRTEWQLLQVDPLPGGGAVLTHIDVTAGKVAEARLRVLLKRYSSATAAGSVGVWELELATDIVAVDAALCALLGYPTAQPQTWAEWHARLHADDAGMVDALRQARCVQAARGENDPPDFGPFDVRFAGAHGGYRTFECRGQVTRDRQGVATHVQGTLLDVTTLRAAQDALERSNAHLQELARRLASQPPGAREKNG